MSLGYADRLTQIDDVGGRLGDPEMFDTKREVAAKIKTLTRMIQESKHVVVYTGAGISTSCGIPDFRGPKGIWTLRKKGLPTPKPEKGGHAVEFWGAKPSLTHQALLALLREGKVAYLVSQNVDNLHVRSGVPPSQLAELHGNCFVEKCSGCGKYQYRDFEMTSVNFDPTGRTCPLPGCGADLTDNVLDWDSKLPDDEYAEALRQSKLADLALTLGTSLQIPPACHLPTEVTKVNKKHPVPGKLVIVNLQKTGKDGKAELLVRAKVDEVMRGVMKGLGMRVPPYVRRDRVLLWHQLHATPTTLSQAAAPAASAASPAAAQQQQQARRQVTIHVSSVHGPTCPMPMLKTATFTFQVPGGGGGAATTTREVLCEIPPFQASLQLPVGSDEARVTVRLLLHQAADPDKRDVVLQYTARVPPPASPAVATNSRRGGGGYEAGTCSSGGGSPAAAAAAAAAAGGGGLLAAADETGGGVPVAEQVAALLPQGAAGCRQYEFKTQVMRYDDDDDDDGDGDADGSGAGEDGNDDGGGAGEDGNDDGGGAGDDDADGDANGGGAGEDGGAGGAAANGQPRGKPTAKRQRLDVDVHASTQ